MIERIIFVAAVTEDAHTLPDVVILGVRGTVVQTLVREGAMHYLAEEMGDLALRYLTEHPIDDAIHAFFVWDGEPQPSDDDTYDFDLAGLAPATARVVIDVVSIAPQPTEGLPPAADC